MFTDRRQKLFDNLDKDIEAVVLFNHENLDVERLIYYYTGFRASFGILIMRRDGHDLLIGDPRYQEVFDDIVVNDSGLSAGEYFNAKVDVKKHLRGLTAKSPIGFASTSRYSEYSVIKRWARGHKLVDIDSTIETQRQIKQPDEVEKINRACEITQTVLEKIPNLLTPGMSELDLVVEIEHHLRKGGATAIAFPTIVASGPNAAIAHWRGSDRRLEDGDMVVIDLGAEYQGYGSDFCQTFIVGDDNARAQEIINKVRDIHDQVVAAAKPGTTISDLGKLCEDLLVQADLDPSMGHALGHGVGMDVHESPHIGPRSPGELKEGMFIALEPGVYIPGHGGCRWESTFLVR